MKKFEKFFTLKFILKIIYSIGILCVAGIIIGSIMMRKVLSDIPSIDKLDEYIPSVTTYVYDINNQIISEFSIEKRALLSLDKIPVDMQNAVIAMEDHKFFKHCGLSLRGITRAFLRNVMRRKAAQGGSTITQQLSKLIFLKPEKTISRKVKEMFLSLQIERNFSKQEILQMYLNQIYFGTGVYGVQSAAKLYFGKDVSEMTLGECALLAGLVSSPETYSPFNHPDKARLRRYLVLKRMLDEKYIIKEEMENANKDPIPDTKHNLLSGSALYFVEYIRQILEPKYGTAHLWKGGMKIYTTLDLNMQVPAEEIMEKYLKKYDEESAKTVSASTQEGSVSTNTFQGAFVLMDVKTGAIKVLIGGRNYRESQFNRVTQAYRQPGSTFKPFVWMSALMRGYLPTTIVDDSPMAYYYDGRDWRLLEDATDPYSINIAIEPFAGNKDFKIWTPNDFDGKFLGQITMRKALELSRNLASVYLVNRIGPTLVAEVAHKAGINRQLDPVPSIGLGTSVVSPFELANAFATFANGGIQVKPFSIMRVLDSQGKVLEEHVPYETENFSPQNAYLLLNMMKGVVLRGTGKHASKLKRPIAGKTGTSQENKDLWFVGMTPDLVATAWMGYDDFAPLGMKDWTGGSTVVPWWTEIMEQILKDQPIRDFPVPDGIVFVTIDSETGKLALPTCKKKILEAFVKDTEPKEFCDTQH
jgi:penicillin-binding protein 1A